MTRNPHKTTGSSASSVQPVASVQKVGSGDRNSRFPDPLGATFADFSALQPYFKSRCTELAEEPNHKTTNGEVHTGQPRTRTGIHAAIQGAVATADRCVTIARGGACGTAGRDTPPPDHAPDRAAVTCQRSACDRSISEPIQLRIEGLNSACRRHKNNQQWFCSSRTYSSLARLVGVRKDVTPHVLRHTFASHKADVGINAYQLQEWLGHASVATTQIYVSLSKANSRQVMEKTSL